MSSECQALEAPKAASLIQCLPTMTISQKRRGSQNEPNLRLQDFIKRLAFRNPKSSTVSEKSWKKYQEKTHPKSLPPVFFEPNPGRQGSGNSTPQHQTLEDSSAAIVTHINRCTQVLPSSESDPKLKYGTPTCEARHLLEQIANKNLE